MNIKPLVFGLVLALVLLSVVIGIGLRGGTAQARIKAQTWYVDRACTACGGGTLEAPFETVNRALDVANEGDTILVAQGMYTENLSINYPVTLLGGYVASSPTWTRDLTRYKTIVRSNDTTVAGDWNGDWLGSCSVIKDGDTYKMWCSAGSEINGESIGYADSPDGLVWSLSSSNPLLAKGSLDSWEGGGVAHPTVLATAGGFQMWYVGLDVLGRGAIGYASSSDGLTWQKHGGNPVLSPGVYDRSSIGFPTVVQDGPNDYKMWYSSSNNIWLATSSDGLSWTKPFTTPVLAKGSSGAWDDFSVYAPHVVAGSSGYEMWYAGEAATTRMPQIGYAWSDDGVTWTKSPANPVLTGDSGTWEDETVTYPALIKEGSADYYMWYRGGVDAGTALGLASSSNGTAWTKDGDNPVLGLGTPTYWGSSVVTLRENSGGTVLDGLTITGGFSKNSGGIHMMGSAPTIRSCMVTDNLAWLGGGGIGVLAGSPLIEHTTIVSNTSAAGWAGGISVRGASPTISASLLINNVAQQNGGGLTVSRNSNAMLIATTVADNLAPRAGGVDIDTGSSLVVYQSTIAGNLAGRAGGLRVRGGTLTMTNTFVVDNQSLAGGPGAISFWQSFGRLVNTTIANNRASSGPGGIEFIRDQTEVSLVILNSILVSNGGDDLSCTDGTCSVTYSNVEEGMDGSGNISIDPRFVAPSIGDYHLRGSSPAIDNGTADGAPTIDFEFDPRPFDGDGDGLDEYDMGADEFTGGQLEEIFLPLVVRDS
jgi:hypothetical protein